jgi:hypothetical protein
MKNPFLLLVFLMVAYDAYAAQLEASGISIDTTVVEYDDNEGSPEGKENSDAETVDSPI